MSWARVTAVIAAPLTMAVVAAAAGTGCTTETHRHPVAVARTDPALASATSTSTASTTNRGAGAASAPIDASAVNVPWADYPPSLQAAIDALIRSHDCNGLHQQLAQAAQSGAAMQSQHGHDNTELIKYVTVGARFVGCAV